jgi:hypothetical protein
MRPIFLAVRAFVGSVPSLTVLLAGCLVGCVPINGGAVEASWVLRTFDGRAISSCGCSSPEISRVRFVVVELGAQGLPKQDLCAGRSDCEFSCSRQSGATSFFIPPNRYAISVAPIGVAGDSLVTAPTPVPAPPTGVDRPADPAVRVPAPILRDVVYGQPTELDAIAIESSCSVACNGEQSNRVCTRD